MMMNDYNYRDILRVEFQSRKARNQYYSLRAFAQAIGIGSGALSEILNGKRNLGVNKAGEIVDKLKLTEAEKEQFLKSIKDKPKKVSDASDRNERNLTMDVFELVSSPACMTILAAADLDDFRLDVEWLAKRLMLDVGEVERSLYIMRNLDLIEVVDGVQKISEDFMLSPDGIPSRAIKNYHHFMLDKASDAIENQEVAMRDISGISFAMDKDDVSNIKKDIQSFQRKMIKKYSAGKRNSVYHIETALFALSREDV